MRRIWKRTALGMSALAVTGLACGTLAAAPAFASHSQIALMQDDPLLLSNPGPTLQEMRHLGVQMVRVTVLWSYIAPSPTSFRRPRFNATDPNDYPAYKWSPYDAIVRDASSDGIKVLFVVTGAAPFWAQAPGASRYRAKYEVDRAFEPSASAYGQFVQAIGRRYSGGFRPSGSLMPLPRVSAWELYNEPNFGEDLAPQAINHSQVLWAPVMLRPLLNAAWSALRATGHGSDTKLIGALAARGLYTPTRQGFGNPGTYGETPPLAFIRDLYCVDSQFHAYRGAAAAARRCPTSSRRFRAQNPALFSASAWSIHPYQLTLDANVPPDVTRYHNPDYVTISQLPNMARTLDRIQRAYGSGKRFPLWNDEYGYITNPPVYGPTYAGCHRNCRHLSPGLAAAYMNWAEYLQWSNTRLASTSQFLLYDPNPTLNTPEYGGFASGLIFYPTILGGKPKDGYFAYRLPIFMQKTSARLGNSLRVWGAVRPAPFAAADRDGRQYVQIQFQQPGGSWIQEKLIPVTDPHGYFQTSVTFPASGYVRTAWTYPADPSLASNLVTPTQTGLGANGYVEPLADTATSRTIKITIR